MSPRPSMENWRLPSPAGSAHPGSRGGGFTQLSNQQGGQTARQRALGGGPRPQAVEKQNGSLQSAPRASRGPRGKSSLMGASKFLATATMTGVANTQKMSAGHRWEDRDAGRVGARTATRGVANTQKMYAGQGRVGREEGGAGACQAGRCAQARWQAGVCVPLKQADSPPAASRRHAGSMVAANTGSSHGHPNTHRRRRGRRGG